MRRRRVLPQIAITVKLPVAIMMYRAILTHTRSVTDRQTDGRTELPYSIRRQHAVRRAVKCVGLVALMAVRPLLVHYTVKVKNY